MKSVVKKKCPVCGKEHSDQNSRKVTCGSNACKNQHSYNNKAARSQMIVSDTTHHTVKSRNKFLLRG